MFKKYKTVRTVNKIKNFQYESKLYIKYKLFEFVNKKEFWILFILKTLILFHGRIYLQTIF